MQQIIFSFVPTSFFESPSKYGLNEEDSRVERTMEKKKEEKTFGSIFILTYSIFLPGSTFNVKEERRKLLNGIFATCAGVRQLFTIVG